MHSYGFAIVGTGNIAQAHVAAIDKLPNAHLVGVTSRSAEKAKALAQQHRAHFFPDLKSLLADDAVDIVTVCTPSGAHLEVAVAAAKAGRHVIVEKPLEITPERAQTIIDAAEANGVKLATVFMSRFATANQRLKRALEAGELGRPLQGDAFVKWYRSQDYYDSGKWRGTWALDGGGALMNQAIHQVDLLLWLLGPVREVFAYADTLNHTGLEVEDSLVAVLRYASGALGILSAATSLYPGSPKVLEIHGTKGWVRLEDDNVDVWAVAGQEQREKSPYSRAVSSTFNDPMAMSFENHRRQFEDFVHAVTTDTSPLVDGYEGLKSVKLVNAIYESVRIGKPVEVA